MSVLTEPVWGAWALDRHTAQELSAHLHLAQPRCIVECGSGMSTVLLAEYAQATGASVVSLEHDDAYAAKTRSELEQRGLERYVDLRVRSLTELDTPVGRLPWYGSGLPSGIDFALVDGPPGKIGRHAALFALMPLMRRDGAWEVWLDDAAREGELNCMALWRTQWTFRDELIPTPKGLARITPPGLEPRVRVDCGGQIAVTLLTGGRPDLLARTVASLTALAPGLLETAHVAVLHNGADPGTAALLDTYGWVDHLTVLQDRLPVAQAAMALLGFPPPRPYVLHLEDDWQVATADTTWLLRAVQVLQEDPRVGQVRLRHRGQTVLKTHMVTRRPLWWTPGPCGTEIAAAHYTLNPSLMRSEQVPQLWPAPNERAAARTFHNLGWLVAQMLPGVFRHIGEGASLRLGERP